ncbi:TIGR03618 family F420-dependent PPOX class oxidoreductase [Actinoplanes sp. NPDC051513]|uniref:TIGR03618 family F420-dependent PPOX class oxidoreductase n=1 Tax=Actinoplanes sp. NPDC051513 TaxID=3363908 RepID=UPI0037B4E15B
MLDPEVRRVLDGTPLAHLATVQPDGAPHTVPLWVATRGEQIVFLTGPHARKVRNLRHDPRVALSIAPADSPWRPVVVRGHVTAWLDGDEGWAVVDEMARKYTGNAYPRDEERIVAVIEPDRQTVGIG